MFEQDNDFNEEGKEVERQESMNENPIWDDEGLSDFDYLKGMLQAEYGDNPLSNSGEITDTGDYDFRTPDKDVLDIGPEKELHRRRANYIMLKRILGTLLPGYTYLGFDILEKNGVLQDTRVQFSPKTGRLLGISYRRSAIDN